MPLAPARERLVRKAADLTRSSRLGETWVMRLRQLVGCMFAVSMLHCGEDATGVTEPIRELTLVTFNAALGVGLAPYAEQRLDAIERDLPLLGADVVCLQEVWLPENIERLTASLASLYPFSLRSVRAAGAAGASCTDAEAALLSSCLSENCASVAPDGLPLCAISSCAGQFTQVSMSCQQCIAANQSAMDVENLASLCAADDGEASSYQDQSGLAILSRHPLEDIGYQPFESSLGDRGLLSARLRTAFMGDVAIHCTHLAATLSEIPYTGAYGSWQGERLRQIEQMLARVAATRPAAGSAVMLGDMNCGPSTALAEAASPDAYAQLVEAGFDDPYVDLDGRCTFCDNNPLNGLVSDPDEGALIDHVLVSATEIPASAATRVFDEVISIDAGGPVDTARSDHYGVLVQLSATETVAP
jgi:endonuclease/exonuclease/phosphatase family metal-dependent hydrolase